MADLNGTVVQSVRQRRTNPGMLPVVRAVTAGWLIVGVGPLAQAGQWSHLASDAARSATAVRGPEDLSQPLWVAPPGASEQFVARSSPVLGLGRVFIGAKLFEDSTHVDNLVIAFDEFSGERLWERRIERSYLDSFSSPAVDERNGRVLIGSRYSFYALDIADGAIVWQTTLPRRVVNASALVTADLVSGGVPSNRAFITDYSGPGALGTLYAINVDPNTPQNPYEPGEIVWTAALNSTSGATPAYAEGVVIAASYTVSQNLVVTGGSVHAFDAITGAPLWQRDVGADDGFFGGVSMARGAVYAATYEFDSGEQARLFKLRRADGVILWSVPCERTASIPVVSASGFVYLACGIEEFGSAVRVQCFKDLETSAQLVWDTFVSGGGLVVGGWTLQPALAGGALYVGRPDPAPFAPYEQLYALDLSKTPADPGFVAASFVGAGGSTAVECGRAYSIGDAGLVAFVTSLECMADINGDGVVEQGDLGVLLACYDVGAEGETGGGGDPCNGEADFNCDGIVDQGDLGILLALWGALCE